MCVVDAVVESLELKEFKKLYRERSRCAYYPKMMLKIILYAYMNNIYSCRKIEKAVRRDIYSAETEKNGCVVNFNYDPAVSISVLGLPILWLFRQKSRFLQSKKQVFYLDF